MTTEQVRETVNSILLVIQIVVIGIAAISLIVGGVGIMNSMYTSVLERTREIGVMKAIGARNSDIMLLFLIESGIIGLVGGIIGCLIGVGLAKGVEFVATQELSTAILKASITPGLIIGALIFSFMVGCISGLLPAKGAAEMNPIDALRYE
ncbi:MAG TPA: FtsX-like permease family protein [Candidatus Altiarchaeales archaeon]|nr:FtsX-like permease family protein [Candidatus Altiarchaeales archaeon]